MSKMEPNLISIIPFGIGTPMVESLFSYLLRLAEKNGVTLTELLRLIADEVDLPLNDRGNIDNNFIRRLNSGSGLSYRIAQVIQRYTGRNDLLLLTMHRWRHLFSEGLLHKSRWFNPSVNLEYDPLLLTINPVYWSIEGAPLEHICHSCGKESLAAQLGHKIGKCPKCNAPLNKYHNTQAARIDKYSSAFLNYNNRDYSVWVANAVGELLAYTGDTSVFSFADAFEKHLRHFGIQAPYDAKRALSVSHISVVKWIKNGVLPRFDQFLNICYCMRVSPVEFFRQDLLQVGSPVELRNSPKQTHTAIASSPRKRIDAVALRETLLQDMESKQYMHLSFREYCAKQLSRSQAVVRQYEPELAKRFVTQNKEYKKIHSRTIRAGRIAEVIEAARICVEMDADINHKNLRHYLVQPGMLMSQWARDLIKLLKIHGPDALPPDSMKI